MYYAFIDEAWSPPSFVKARAASPPPTVGPTVGPPTVGPTVGPTVEAPTATAVRSPSPKTVGPATASLKDIFESLYAQGYGFRNLLELLPTPFQLEAREHFRDASSGSGSSGPLQINTNTITTILLSGVLFLIFYDALSKLFRI